ncbi:hypothetical protein AB0B54_19735 [Microbispora bryophytorum]|uniref:hypothetical protein n=1 Tax=Microbispora bryophytorum TaxID=1460882 RepID=UPI0033C4C1F0
MSDPALHGRQPLPLEQPQQARSGVAVRAANAVEPTNAVKGVKVTEDVTVAARSATVTLGVLSMLVALVAHGVLSTAVTAVTAVTLGVLVVLVVLVAVAGQAVVRVVAGVHRPPPRPAAPRWAGRSVCILSFTMQPPGRVVHRQGTASATGAEIA